MLQLVMAEIGAPSHTFTSCKYLSINPIVSILLIYLSFFFFFFFLIYILIVTHDLQEVVNNGQHIKIFYMDGANKCLSFDKIGKYDHIVNIGLNL